MVIRWDQWFSEDNLKKDKRILSAQHTKTVEKAAQEYLARDKHNILDLACGVGRDSFYLESCGLGVTCVDASFNGLRVVQRLKIERGLFLKVIMADARHLPFKDKSFEGVYCFGLLHEFTSESQDKDVQDVMSEVGRLLSGKGVMILTVQAGNPEEGLPKVQKYSREKFEQVTKHFQMMMIMEYDDVGCTSRTDYHIWSGLFTK